MAASTINVTSFTLPRVLEPTYQSTNEVLRVESTDPVARSASTSRPTDLPAAAVDSPKHRPGSLRSGMEPEDYMEYIDCMERAMCNNTLYTASEVAMPMTTANHREQQQTAGAARCADSHGGMDRSLSADRLSAGRQLRTPDDGARPAIASDEWGTDENGYMHLSHKVGKCVRVYCILNSDFKI